MKPIIYIIEDDRALREELMQLLELQGFDARSFIPESEGFKDASTSALAVSPDCVLVDLKLPDTSGHSICRDIRRESDVPIMIITSSDNEFDEVMGMDLGADDYMVKPYSPAVLIAHIQSLLRRSKKDSLKDSIEYRGLTLHLSSARLEFEGDSCDLTRNELKILHLLMGNPGTVITRQEIMSALWDSDEFIDDNTLTVNVNRLRKKLSNLGVQDDFLETRRGQGYIVR